MRNLRWAGLVVLVLCFAMPAMAQNYSPFQAEAGYTLLHATNAFGSGNANGGNADLFYNANGWLSLGGDIAGVTGFGLHIYTYQFGPRIYFSRGTFQPFAQALFGGAHFTAGGPTANSFNYDLGGGLDIKISHHFAVRPVEMAYEHFSLTGVGFNNLRYSTGLVFHF